MKSKNSISELEKPKFDMNPAMEFQQRRLGITKSQKQIDVY